MVYLHLKTTCKEVPISDIIATGQLKFFANLSENSTEFRGQNKERFRFLHNGRLLSEENLKNVDDNNSIRVILLPESKIKKPSTNDDRKKIDSELSQIVAPYKNPEDRRNHGFAHDFALPDHMTKIMKAHPRLVFDSEFISVLQDWYMFRGHCVRNTFKGKEDRGGFKYSNPEFLAVVKELLATIGARYGFSQNEQFRPVQRPGGQQQGAQPITQALLQNALQAALAGVAAAPPTRQAAPPAPVQAQPPALDQQEDEPMQQGYEQQVAQLQEYGFENRELILLALEQTDGNVEAAAELLIDLQS
ncbi:Protein CBG21708 [Caenorhabditis briggsae]|uniref:Protein CBG21708 n=2 Tax=Caenorhabditis briggsae TaxID=6238 RepID=A8Y0P0_CAEBR|nr:Protein CBG21708 [Caenorhabditis briggsae]ULT94110.1 hypothetical protein L3Y34_003524 [Caenorhabditis briggsae]CAP38460.1 Protein CBG21708 [Caenorhabditis briggsae]